LYALCHIRQQQFAVRAKIIRPHDKNGGAAAYNVTGTDLSIKEESFHTPHRHRIFSVMGLHLDAILSTWPSHIPAELTSSKISMVAANI